MMCVVLCDVCCVVRGGKDNDDHHTAAHRSRMACTMSSDDVDQCRLKKEKSDQMRISSVPSETGKSKPRIFLVIEKDILYDKKNILQYEETETESRPHHPLFWKEDTG